jgi:hypothetical protein
MGRILKGCTQGHKGRQSQGRAGRSAGRAQGYEGPRTDSKGAGKAVVALEVELIAQSRRWAAVKRLQGGHIEDVRC